MKRKLRGLCLIGIFLLVIVNINPVRGSFNRRKVIYTAITKISSTSFLGPELCENCTQFDFLLDYEILNPRIRKITLAFPYYNLHLLPNVTAVFEDTNYTLAPDYIVGLPAFSQRTFDPGITCAKYNYRIAILAQNLTTLPNGEYTFLIYGYWWLSSVVFNETIMTISDEGTNILYGTLPPLDIIPQKRSLFFIHIGLVLAFVFVLIPKRKRRL
ncbi:MAG: hypothetical protein GNW80_17415 [Asgard group archaeon]|nr:hypothetical protein [Asgard group archaeon]